LLKDNIFIFFFCNIRNYFQRYNIKIYYESECLEHMCDKPLFTSTYDINRPISISGLPNISRPMNVDCLKNIT